MDHSGKEQNSNSGWGVPPPLGTTRNTPARFLAQVSELIHYLFTNHKNLVLLGDFNIHVNKLDNQNTQSYIDTMEALGLV